MTHQESADLVKARAHYEKFPYDVNVRGSEAYLSPDNDIGRFLRSVHGGLGLDIGCGPGNITASLRTRVDYTVGIDISRASLARADAALGRSALSLVQGSALVLPFRQEAFNVVIATGSLHHTPKPSSAFVELGRVLKPQGRAFVALYRSASYYSVLYDTVGSLARLSETTPVTALLLNRILALPLFLFYMVAGRWVVHRKLTIPTYTQTLNYFADQFLNPVISFCSESDVREWAAAAHLEVVAIATSHAGALLNIELKRP